MISLPTDVPPLQLALTAPLFAKRASGWEHCAKLHLEEFPTCAGCGGTDELQVHHKYPFHLYPEFELDPRYHITLCAHPTRLCHLMLGHCGDWKAWNPHVFEDAAERLDRIKNRRYDRAAKGPKRKLAARFADWALGTRRIQPPLLAALPAEVQTVGAASVTTLMDLDLTEKYKGLEGFPANDGLVAVLQQVLRNQNAMLGLLNADQSAAQKITADVEQQTQSLADAVSAAKLPS